MGWVGWIVTGILGLAAVDLVIRLIYVGKIVAVFEQGPPVGAVPASPDPDVEVVRFPTSDGLTLAGSLHRGRQQPARGVVLFCPEFDGSHWSAANYCAGLLQADFDVFAFDFRNQGESDPQPGYRPLHWLTSYEVSDVNAAINYIGSRPDLRDLPLGLFGMSRGAGAALAAAATHPKIACIACDGAFTTMGLAVHYTRRWATLYVPAWLLKLLPVWHLRQTVVLARWRSQIRKGCRYTLLEKLFPRLRDRSVLLIAGQRDNYVPSEVTEILHRGLSPACGEIWFVPGARHNMARQSDPETYDRHLVRFFSQMTADVTADSCP